MTARPLYEEPSYPEYAIDAEAREQIDLLRADLGSLAAAQDEASRRLDHLYSVALLSSRDTAELARSVRRLAARVRWLEEQARAADSGQIADLAVADAELLDLADAMRAGWDAEDRLLAPDVRAGLQGAVDWYARIEQKQAEAAQEIMSISAALASSTRTDPVHQRQIGRFAEAEQRLAAASDALAKAAPSAQRSRDQLDADDERRADLGPDIESGRAAQGALDASLYELIVRETERGALLPTWFLAVLGPAPGPDTDADSRAAWFGAATGVLAFRLAYGIDDPESALGPAPGPNGPEHHADNHTRLTAALNALELRAPATTAAAAAVPSPSLSPAPTADALTLVLDEPLRDALEEGANW